MASLVSPGINVTEVDLTTIVPAVSTTRAAFAGLFRWGPIGQRVLVNSEDDLVKKFGKPTNHNAETFFTAASFLSYGNALYVVRAANTTTAGASNSAFSAVAKKANTSTPTTSISGYAAELTIKNRDDYLDKEASGGFIANAYYIAKYAGDIGNSLKISVCDSVNAYSSNVSLTNVIGANVVANSTGVASDNGLVLKFSGANSIFTAGDTVVYYNNGDTSITTLTNGGTYYIIASNSTAIKISSSYGGSSISAGSIPSTNVKHKILKKQQQATLVANTTGFIAASDVLAIASASSRFAVGDAVYYEVPTNNAAITGLSANTCYYISFANATHVALSLTSGGANVDITSTSTTNPAESHQLYNVQNYNPVTGEFKMNSVNFSGQVATLTFTPMFVSNAINANTFANTVKNSFANGDLLNLGNTTIGKQTVKVKYSAAPVISGSNAVFYIYTAPTKYKLHTEFKVSNTINGDILSQNIQRRWEFSDIISGAPNQTPYNASYGNTSASDAVHVVVFDANGKFTGSINTVLERFPNLSRAIDAKSPEGASIYYKNVINDSSGYVWWANDREGASSANAKLIASSSNYLPYTADFVSGSDGWNETTVSLGTIADGYNLFASKETSDVSLILQGKPIGGETLETDYGYDVNNYALANWLIDNVAEDRLDCVAFITPDDSLVRTNKGNEADALVAWRSVITDSTYAVIDSGYKYMYDKYNDVYRYVPSNGDIAGLCARTEQTNDAWWSPAGFNRGQIKNVIKMRWNPHQADRDLIYKNSINPIVPFPGQGTILYGDKTATLKPSAFDRINVRRLFIVLEKAIAAAAQYSLFEFNDESTRSQFRNIVVPYLRDIQARRGITDFLVVCDSTNNTAERINRNEFWGDIYIKPNRSINFIQLNFVAVRTGVSFNTITGQLGGSITPSIV
jgi:hypothetical protein